MLFDVIADALGLAEGGAALRTRLVVALLFLSLMMMGEDQPEAEPEPLPCPLSRDSSAEQVQTSSQIGQRTSSLAGDHCFTNDFRFFDAGSALVGLMGVGDRRGEASLVTWLWLERGDRRAAALPLLGEVERATGVCAGAGLPARL